MRKLQPYLHDDVRWQAMDGMSHETVEEFLFSMWNGSTVLLNGRCSECARTKLSAKSYRARP